MDNNKKAIPICKRVALLEEELEKMKKQIEALTEDMKTRASIYQIPYRSRF